MTSDEINNTNKEIDISDFLQLEGIGPAANKEIKKGGYVSILQLAAAMQEDVENSCDISADKAKKYIKAAQEWLDQSGVMNSRVTSGLDDLERREQMQKITTGSSNLDTLLKGGIETQAITEFYGSFGSGKTQLCNMIAINAQLPPEKGGISAKGVIYIDTEGTFRPERIKNICIELGLDYREILSNITRIRTGTLMEFIYRIKTLSNEIERRNAKVIIIDSIISRSRQEKIGRGTLADRQQVLGQLLHRIMRCAEIYNAAVILANQVQANPDTYGDPTKPAGGNVLGHASTYRLSLRRSGKKTVVTMVDSPMGKYDSVDIEITERGIEDFVENRKSAKAKKQGKENKETETSESQEQPQEDSESEHDLVIA